MIERLQLPEFMPDQSNNSGVLLRCNNVFPAQDGYRAVSNVDPISDALTGTFLVLCVSSVPTQSLSLVLD